MASKGLSLSDDTTVRLPGAKCLDSQLSGGFRRLMMLSSRYHKIGHRRFHEWKLVISKLCLRGTFYAENIAKSRFTT